MGKTVGYRLRRLMDKAHISSKELAEKAGISPTWVSYLINDKRTLSNEIAEKLAEILGVDPGHITGEAVSVIVKERAEVLGMPLEEVAEKAKVELKWLENLDSFIPGEDDALGPSELAWDATIGGYRSYEWITRVADVIGLPGAQLRAALARQEVPVYNGSKTTPEEDFYSAREPAAPYNIYPNSTKIPVLGSISAGLALEAVEDIVAWEEIPESWLNGDREYFGLIVRGDSMFPEYLENDTVIIRKQNCCDSGDDCAVMVGDTDATLKRVKKYEDGIELEAINPMYGKKKYTNEEVLSLPVTILGVVVELRRKKK